MFTNRKAIRRAARQSSRVSMWNASTRACAFEGLEDRRLMRSAVELPTLPPLPTAPAKPPVVADATPPVQNPGWQRPTTPVYFEGEAGHEHEEGHEHGNGPDFVLGPKWFQSGGPGTPLMLSYSIGPSLNNGLGPLSATQVRSAVEEAYQLWSSVTPLQFEQVNDPGLPVTDVDFPPLLDMPVMRFAQHGIGPGVLAHAWMPMWGSALAGDVHFDTTDPWSTHPSSGFDILETATHEIGHGLGLDHQPTNINAIMNPSYVGRFNGPGTGFLLPDDIAGIQAHYGRGLGYVLNSSGTMFISGTEGANTISLTVSGSTIIAVSDGLGSFTRSTAGVSRIVINSRGGNDIVRIESNGGIATDVNTGAGDDFVDFSFQNRDLDNITGSATVHGGAGNDHISVFDHNNTPAATYTVSHLRFDRPGWGGFFYGVDVESESMVTGRAADAVNVLSTWGNQPVTLDSSGGNDTVNIGNGTNGMQSISAWVAVNNGAGTSTLNLNNGAGNLPRTLSVDSIPVVGYTFVTGLAPEVVRASIAGVGAINLTTGTAADTVNVTRNTETLTLNSGGGEDTVNLGSVENGVQGITGAVTVLNAPFFTRLNINDGASAQPRTAVYDIAGGFTQVTGLAPAMIRANNNDIRAIILTTGTGSDTLNVARNSEDLTLDSGGGNDTVNVGNAVDGVQSITGNFTLRLGAASSVLNLNNAADTTSRNATIDLAGASTEIIGLAPVTIRTEPFAAWPINLTTGRGSLDSVRVARTHVPVTLDSGGGFDAVTIGNSANGVQSIGADVTVLNSAGETMLTLDDAANTAGRNATMDVVTIGGAPHGRLTGLTQQTVTWKYAGLATAHPVYVRAGSGNDTFTVAGMPDTRRFALTLGAGDDTANVNATGANSASAVDGGAGHDTLRVNGTSPTGPLTILPSAGNDDVSVNTDGAGTANVLFETTQRIGALAIGNGGNAEVAQSPGTPLTLVVGDVNIANGGRLDLTDEDLIWDYTGASPVAGLRQLLAAGYNGGQWNGSGIMSSAAAAAQNTAIGYAESADVFASFPATFAGQSVDNTALLLKHTFYGDANLDGNVNLVDFNRLTAGFGQPNARWSNGNFDFDNDVDLADFNRLVGNFGGTGLLPDGLASVFDPRSVDDETPTDELA